MEAVVKEYHGVPIPSWLTVEVLDRLIKYVQEVEFKDPGYLCWAVDKVFGEYSDQSIEWPCFLIDLNLGTGSSVFEDNTLAYSKLTHLIDVPRKFSANNRRIVFLNEIKEVLNA